MEKYELGYVNYETTNGTKKDFEKVTEDLKHWDIKPIENFYITMWGFGTVKDICDFTPELIKVSGMARKYYIHKCLIIMDHKDGSIVDFIYKTRDGSSYNAG